MNAVPLRRSFSAAHPQTPAPQANGAAAVQAQEAARAPSTAPGRDWVEEVRATSPSWGRFSFEYDPSTQSYRLQEVADAPPAPQSAGRTPPAPASTDASTPTTLPPAATPEPPQTPPPEPAPTLESAIGAARTACFAGSPWRPLDAAQGATGTFAGAAGPPPLSAATLPIPLALRAAADSLGAVQVRLPPR